MATKVKKVAEKEKAVKGTPGRKVPEGLTGINTLAEELDMPKATIRRRLRTAKVEKVDGVYAWKGKELDKIRKLLRD